MGKQGLNVVVTNGTYLGDFAGSGYKPFVINDISAGGCPSVFALDKITAHEQHRTVMVYREGGLVSIIYNVIRDRNE